MRKIFALTLSVFLASIVEAQVTNFPYSESFENGLGLWTQSTSDDRDWTRRSGGTPSSYTGPSAATDGTYYMYTEASGNSNKTAILESPEFVFTGATSALMSFDYHMYGESMGELQVEMKVNDGAWETILTVSGDQGNVWHTSTYDLGSIIECGQSTTTVEFNFKGTTGSSYKSDITIDDFKIVEIVEEQDLSAMTYPMIEDFEVINALGSIWDNNDGVGWSRERKQTYPAVESASGSYHLRFDASEHGGSDQVLMSNFVFQPGDSATLSLYYKMSNPDVGVLTIRLSQACQTAIVLDSLEGNQGSGWQYLSIDISSYVDGVSASALTLELVAEANSNANGDILIDLISVNDGTMLPSSANSLKWKAQSNDGVFLDQASVAVAADQFSSEYELLVNGTISASEILVDATNVPDYVFLEGYPLRSISALENYIKYHGHLPEIEPASSFEKNGLRTSEFSMKLLKKIEELTLLMIELDKQQKKQLNLINDE